MSHMMISVTDIWREISWGRSS